MPLADALARFRIDRAFGAADAATIREVVSDAYRGSPTARAMLDRLPEEGRTLRVWFETGEFGAGDDAIFIDLAWLRGNAYLAPSGTAVADTPTTAIVHELVHAIEGLLDYPSFPEDRFTTDTAGPTVTRANAIYGELGLPRQLSYDGYASEGELVVGRNYTGGQRVDHALFAHGSLDTSRLGGDSRELVIGWEGRDDIRTGGGGDVLLGGGGDDLLDGGRGSDRIEGGGGVDVVRLRGLDGGGFDLLRRGDEIVALDRADRSRDVIRDADHLDSLGQRLAAGAVGPFDALAYLASHDDLAAAFGADAAQGLRHYVERGFFEGREVTFDAAQYLANHSDLGDDEARAARHYLEAGRAAGRLAEDPLSYVASFEDLSRAFGGLGPEELRAAGLRHYRAHGAQEGRRAEIDFDPQAYLGNHADLRAAFGGDGERAAHHFAASGRAAGRLAQDALDYVASFDDLIRAAERFDGDAAAIRRFGVEHFRKHGAEEGRAERVDFDADAYLANHADLRRAFADGAGSYDEGRATLHYVAHGFEEGRADELILL